MGMVVADFFYKTVVPVLWVGFAVFYILITVIGYYYFVRGLKWFCFRILDACSQDNPEKLSSENVLEPGDVNKQAQRYIDESRSW